MKTNNVSARLQWFCDRYADGILSVLLVVLDYAMVVGAEYLSYRLRNTWLPIANELFYVPPVYLYVIVPTIFLCFLHSSEAHMRSVPFWKMAQNVFWAVFYSVLTITMLMYFGKVAEVVSRLFVGMTGIFSFLFILSGRYFFKRYINERKLFQIPVLFIGAGRTAELVLDSFEHDSGFGYRILGFIEDHPEESPLRDRVRILGRFENIERVIRMTGVREVIIAVPGLSSEKQVELVNRIQPLVKNVSFVPDLVGAPVGTIDIETLVDSRLMLLRVHNNLAQWKNRMFKRFFDVVVSCILLLGIVPIGLAISFLIFMDSPGPVLFRQKRIGRNNKDFVCYKFRSMYMNADEMLEKYFAEHPEAREEWEEFAKLRGEDPRVTPVGKWIRRYSLDELPQIINVIKGEMSLVGPRPYLPREAEMMGEYLSTIVVTVPGITGLWQISGRNDISFQGRLHLDAWYVRNWSVWMDIVYLLKTVKVVFGKKGAY